MNPVPENSGASSPTHRQYSKFQPEMPQNATLAACVSLPWDKPIQPITRPFLTYAEQYQKEEEHRALVKAIKDRAHAQRLLSQQPHIVRLDVQYQASVLEKEQGLRRAEAFLSKTFVDRILPRVNLVSERYQIQEASVDNAHYLARFNRIPDMTREDVELLANDIAQFVLKELETVAGERPEESDLKRAYVLYLRAAAITQAYHQPAPHWDKLTGRFFSETEAIAAISRMTSDKWWLGRLRRLAAEWREHLQISINRVSKQASIYASKMTIAEWKEQKHRTKEFIKSMELEDEEGNRISLIDKYYGSVANPAIRRTEMMVRIRGFENICNELGYVAEFYTLTAPSKYHATTRHGHRNRKWNGSSPADTQHYLSGLWAKIRAKLHRNNLRIFGIRVAEPHHDGTPHWHMLFFMQPEQADQVRDIIRDYALQEDRHELRTAKALKARFHAEKIDPEKGSATGYVAKYISKNIDGYAMDGDMDDESGRPIKDAAIAASAWAGRWRIRQFQFVGGAPVTVYRELRRMADHETAMGLSVEFAAVHDAADNGDWANYINAQGGPFVRREDLVARLWYETEQETNAHGEDVIRIKGVFSPFVGVDTPILTRLKSWKIVPKLAEATAEAGFSGASAPPRSSVNNCTVAHCTVDKGMQESDLCLDEFYHGWLQLSQPEQVKRVQESANLQVLEVSEGLAKALIRGNSMTVEGQRYRLSMFGQIVKARPPYTERTKLLLNRLSEIPRISMNNKENKGELKGRQPGILQGISENTTLIT
ncbi:Replication gene A protein [Xenorhabdus cabanillasii JM26]|uniref:Replication gene A protein n=2 Tax=Xenorhabdus cabanillasii TaxID=351673 RepID=W1ITB3_9GAMM|nr:replication protein A [Xenorhabdus cabanillasii JM26]CDL80445.1 Replication gene A protein [Xenorhabdus cabanillasii JM26]